MTNVIDLGKAREMRASAALTRILTAYDIGLPENPYVAGDENIAVLMDHDWRKMDELFDAFELTRPPELPWPRLVEMWVYLTGRVGRHLKLRIENPRLYFIVTKDLEPKMLAYMEALFLGERSRARSLAAELDLWTNAPKIDD